MSYQNILTERVDKIALITLNRPEKLNALRQSRLAEFSEAIEQVAADPTRISRHGPS